MKKIGGVIGATVAGLVVGAATGRLGFVTSFMLSTVASGFGLYYGRQFFGRYE
jgi:hypothetical protein